MSAVVLGMIIVSGVEVPVMALWFRIVGVSIGNRYCDLRQESWGFGSVGWLIGQQEHSESYEQIIGFKKLRFISIKSRHLV